MNTDLTKPPYSTHQLRLAKIAKALSHPARVAILEMLQSQSCCFHGDMADELPIAKSTLSQHLNELKDAGLVQGNVNPPAVKYCINKDNWDEAQAIIFQLFGKNS
jgi:predicted transcriptional regulator